MSSPLPILAIKALDGLTARSAVVADNIANANSPGFRPRQLSFEAALRNAAFGGPDAIGAVEPRIAPAGDAAEGVRLDQAMADAAATALRYSAIANVLSRQLSINRLAVSGRR